MRQLGGKHQPLLTRLSRGIGQALNPGILAGLSFSGWLRLLWRVRFRVNVRYWPRALSITLFSVMNSLIGCWESRRYARQWRDVQTEPPLFIIGAPRSGTTFLHNLICTNPEFAYPSLIECRLPLSFLTLGRLMKAVMPLLFSRRRAQDNVGFGPDIPAEEESALLSKSLISHQLDLVFPRQHGQFARFRYASCYTDTEKEQWVSAYRAFVRKLSGLKKGMLVFKNPANTTKLKLLAQAFPGARFVFIHRHPAEVVSSNAHTSQVVRSFWSLQSLESSLGIGSAQIIGKLIREYLDCRSAIAPDRLVEVSYDELSQNPVTTIEQIYRALNLPGFESAEPSLQAYLESVGEYRKNRHEALDSESREWLYQDCPEWFTEWGYEK